MAANFWTSSHCVEWLRNVNEDMNTELQIEKRSRNSQILTDDEVKKLRVHLGSFVSNLGKHQHVKSRQRVIATATVYLARFFYNNSYKDFHPHLIAATALYLASKVEESPVQPAKIANALKDTSVWAAKYGVNDIVDGEYFLMEELKFNLIVFHPYRPLQLYLADAGFDDIISTSWYLVNDSYRLDICLAYPPHITAIAAICIAGAYSNHHAEVNRWFTEKLNFNNEHRQQVHEVMSQMLEMYEEFSHLEPDEVHELFNKIPNPPAIGSAEAPPAQP